MGHKHTPETIERIRESCKKWFAEPSNAYDRSWTLEARQRHSLKKKQEHLEKYKDTPWEELSRYDRKKRLLEECNHRCQICNHIDVWNGKHLILQYDHIDGDAKNFSRANSRMLCPNCHTQTPTYGSPGMTDDERSRHRKAIRASKHKKEEKCW